MRLRPQLPWSVWASDVLQKTGTIGPAFYHRPPWYCIGALWHIDSLRLRNILTYLLTYWWTILRKCFPVWYIQNVHITPDSRFNQPSLPAVSRFGGKWISAFGLNHNKNGDVYKVKKVNLRSALLRPVSKALRYGPCETRGPHSLTCHPHTNHTCLPQPQGVIALWLILIAPTHEGMARLSWPGWLVIVAYRDKCPSPGIEPRGQGRSPVSVLTGRT